MDITFKRKLFLKVVCLRVSHPNSTVPVVAASCSASLYSIKNIRRHNIRRRGLTVADSLFFFTLLWEGFNCSRKKTFIFTIIGHAIDVGDYVKDQLYPWFKFYFPLVWTMVMLIKFQPRVKLNHNKLRYFTKFRLKLNLIRLD